MGLSAGGTEGGRGRPGSPLMIVHGDDAIFPTTYRGLKIPQSPCRAKKDQKGTAPEQTNEDKEDEMVCKQKMKGPAIDEEPSTLYRSRSLCPPFLPLHLPHCYHSLCACPKLEYTSFI